MDRDAAIEDLRRRVEAIEQRGRRPKSESAIPADVLVRWRHAAGLSQRDLAAHLGVTGAAVHGWERGGVAIDEKRARKIRRVIARRIERIDSSSRSQEQNQALVECEG